MRCDRKRDNRQSIDKRTLLSLGIHTLQYLQQWRSRDAQWSVIVDSSCGAARSGFEHIGQSDHCEKHNATCRHSTMLFCSVQCDGILVLAGAFRPLNKNLKTHFGWLPRTAQSSDRFSRRSSPKVAAAAAMATKRGTWPTAVHVSALLFTTVDAHPTYSLTHS